MLLAISELQAMLGEDEFAMESAAGARDLRDTSPLASSSSKYFRA